MVSTFYTPRRLSPEEVNPMSGLLSKALETYGKGLNASYAPRRMEADIFAKEIGPLAALASNPNFTGFNPEVQKMITQRIGGYLGGAHGSNQEPSESTPGYASDEDIFKRLHSGAESTLTPGGKKRVRLSTAASYAEQLGLPENVSKILGGHGAAGENAAFEQAKIEAEQRLIMKGYSPQKAHDAVQPFLNEPYDSYVTRLEPLFINKNKQEKVGQEETSSDENKSEKTMKMFLKGEMYHIPSDKIYEALKEGFTYAP